MKRFILSLALLSMGASAFAPAAVANEMNRQSSSRSGDVSLAEFVRRNRDARSKS